MNFDNVTTKQLNELEHQVTQLMTVMRKAKLQHEPLMEALQALERELGEARRIRFDAANPKYQDY